MKILILFLTFGSIWCHRSNNSPARDVTCNFIIDEVRGYVCEVKNFKYYDENDAIRFTGEQLNKNSNEDVNYLQITDSDVQIIPSETIMTYFINLQRLDIRNSHVKVLTPLANCYSLDVVLLSDNEIKSLDAGIFVECSGLEHLDLSRNQISKIHDNAFGSLKSIYDVNLSSNKIHKLTRKIIKPLKNVKKLNLRENNLKDIPHDTFYDLFHLTDLDLSENPLTRLDFRMFEYSIHVENLKLNSLQIKTLDKFIFKSLRRLETLDISRNSLKVIEGELLSTNKNLVEVKMNYCEVQQIGREFFDKFESLKKTEARGNLCVDGSFEGDIVNYRPAFLKCFENFDSNKGKINKGNYQNDEL